MLEARRRCFFTKPIGSGSRLERSRSAPVAPHQRVRSVAPAPKDRSCCENFFQTRKRRRIKRNSPACRVLATRVVDAEPDEVHDTNWKTLAETGGQISRDNPDDVEFSLRCSRGCERHFGVGLELGHKRRRLRPL